MSFSRSAGVPAALFLLLTTPALAEVSRLDPVVVTGTRTERLSRESPVRTETVSAEEARTLHARDLKEALQYLPGLQLREIHGKSGYEVWIQGLNADRVLILVDGLPVSPTTGSSVDVTQLSLLDIDRIEVVKGATSALYGSAAMGGVVNIITRPIARGVRGELSLDGGTYGDQNPDGEPASPSTHHVRVGASAGGEQWRGRLSADENASDGIDPDPDSWPQPGDEFKRDSVDARVEWHDAAERGQIYGQAGQFDEDIEQRSLSDINADNRQDRLQKNGDLTRQRVTSGGHWKFGNGLRLALDGVQEKLSEDTPKYLYSDVGVAALESREADYHVERYNSRIELPEWHSHFLMLGLDYGTEKLQQKKFSATELAEDSPGTCELQVETGQPCSEVERNADEYFVQDDWFISDDLELLLGARYQDDSDFGSHFSPKLNLRYQLLQNGAQDAFLRLGWGSGYRVPNLKERYYVFDHSHLGYMVIGNPDLQPEESSSWQAGVGWQWQQNLTLDLNFFHNSLTDLIQTDFDYISNNVAYYRYLNVEEASTQGMEVAARWDVSDSLTLNGGYTFLDTENKVTGGELTRRPRHHAVAGVDWRLPALSTTTSLRWRAQSDELLDSGGDARSPGWGVLDLKLNFDVNESSRLFGGLDNLFNRQRDFTNPGMDFAPLAGRYLYVGVALTFGDPH